jgi:hypothetical protein
MTSRRRLGRVAHLLQPASYDRVRTRNALCNEAANNLLCLGNIKENLNRPQGHPLGKHVDVLTLVATLGCCSTRAGGCEALGKIITLQEGLNIHPGTIPSCPSMKLQISRTCTLAYTLSKIALSTSRNLIDGFLQTDSQVVLTQIPCCHFCLPSKAYLFLHVGRVIWQHK